MCVCVCVCVCVFTALEVLIFGWLAQTHSICRHVRRCSPCERFAKHKMLSAKEMSHLISRRNSCLGNETMRPESWAISGRKLFPWPAVTQSWLPHDLILQEDLPHPRPALQTGTKQNSINKNENNCPKSSSSCQNHYDAIMCVCAWEYGGFILKMSSWCFLWGSVLSEHFWCSFHCDS